MSKKVLILSESPRKEGNSDILCDKFMRGAVESGNDVEKVRVADLDIGFCLGCYFCMYNGVKMPVLGYGDDIAMISDRPVRIGLFTGNPEHPDWSCRETVRQDREHMLVVQEVRLFAFLRRIRHLFRNIPGPHTDGCLRHEIREPRETADGYRTGFGTRMFHPRSNRGPSICRRYDRPMRRRTRTIVLRLTANRADL